MRGVSSSSVSLLPLRHRIIRHSVVATLSCIKRAWSLFRCSCRRSYIYSDIYKRAHPHIKKTSYAAMGFRQRRRTATATAKRDDARWIDSVTLSEVIAWQKMLLLLVLLGCATREHLHVHTHRNSIYYIYIRNWTGTGTRSHQ